MSAAFAVSTTVPAGAMLRPRLGSHRALGPATADLSPTCSPPSANISTVRNVLCASLYGIIPLLSTAFPWYRRRIAGQEAGCIGG